MQDNCVFKAGFSQLSIYRIFCVDESVYRVIAGPNPNYCQVPSPAVTMDVQGWLRPTLYYLYLLWICRTTYVQLTDATTTVEMYSRTSLQQRLQEVYNKLYNKSTTNRGN